MLREGLSTRALLEARLRYERAFKGDAGRREGRQEMSTWTAREAPGGTRNHQGGRKGPFGQPRRHQGGTREAGKDHLDSLRGTREAGKDHLDSPGGTRRHMSRQDLSTHLGSNPWGLG